MASAIEGSILFVELPGFKALPHAEALHAAAGEHEHLVVTSVGAAKRALAHSPIALCMLNGPEFDLLSHIRDNTPQCQTILVTDLPMKDYSTALHGMEYDLAQHVIANRSREDLTIHDVRVTIQKLLTGDIFGIEKYLLPSTMIQRAAVTGTKDRDILNQRVAEFAAQCQMSQQMSKGAFGICEELLMNTIHDAPAAAGLKEYLHMSRETPIVLKPEYQGELSFGCDGQTFAISSSDPFGALKRPVLMQYARKILMRRDSAHLIDDKVGGAGLGFFKILYSSHALICNVQAGKRTEIMALIDIQEPLRDFAKMARSIHFFATK